MLSGKAQFLVYQCNQCRDAFTEGIGKLQTRSGCRYNARPYNQYINLRNQFTGQAECLNQAYSMR